MRLRSFGLSLLLCSAAIVGCVWLSGNRVPIYNVVNAPLNHTGTIKHAGEQIRRAARMQNWEIEEVRSEAMPGSAREPGRMSVAQGLRWGADGDRRRVGVAESRRPGE